MLRFIIANLLCSTIALAGQDKLAEYAVNHPERLASDRQYDINRQPIKVLNFFDVRPGMTVIDVFSGRGYYSELAALMVGEKGKVIAHNNKAYIDYLKDSATSRYINRLANVETVSLEANELTFAHNSADIVFLFLSFHDIYYRPDNGSWPTIDKNRFLSGIFNSLKPGGTLAIIDHHALESAGTKAGHSLHRIPKTIVIKELTEAGFKLTGEATFLENSEDDLAKHMYSAEIRGKTSRFVLKFIKPFSAPEQMREQRDIP
ncbi:MAG: methyltransferase domain-containing protein [Kangiellaceae bacterium]|jgi:predicted methyltransferase|nr:methyltransferase domain-containing protein [Kangiellaceae bacterium]